MGVVWSSPYRWQLLAVCFGLFVLTTGLVFLLLSIGLEDALWRLAGGVCASMGSALAVTGTCWCVWVVRHGRYGDNLAVNIPDCEADALTGEGATNWHETMTSGGCGSKGFYDDDDMATDDDVDYEDDEDEGEEECESEVNDVKDDLEAGEVNRGHDTKGEEYVQCDGSGRTMGVKDSGPEERLIPV